MANDSHPHSYLLFGQKGVGKTTIARLIGKYFNCRIEEIDAASYSKVEDMRVIVHDAQHMSLAGTGHRMFLIDECHRLSANAWDSLLKLIEEPPEHLYIALCTTNRSRVPATIGSRCYSIQLRPIRREPVEDYLWQVANMEGWTVRPEIMAAVVTAARGSMRVGLTVLQGVHDCQDKDEVHRIAALQLEDEEEPVIKLLRFILQGGKAWNRVQEMLAEMDDEETDYGETLIRAANYTVKVIIHAKAEADARRAWTILEALTFPHQSYDPKVVLFAALSRLHFG
jgi:DNA polymerase-3 subunit gamma/tau